MPGMSLVPVMVRMGSRCGVLAVGVLHGVAEGLGGVSPSSTLHCWVGVVRAVAVCATAGVAERCRKWPQYWQMTKAGQHYPHGWPLACRSLLSVAGHAVSVSSST
jgi:hypothetical protein